MIKTNRHFADMNNAKLRRARRLYKFLVARTLANCCDYAPLLAQRAIEAGLYAQSNSLSDVTFSLMRGAYKYTRQPHEEWLEWSRARHDENHYPIWHRLNKLNYYWANKTKLRLRIKT